jgi:predicted nucleic acid-binding protein
MEFTNVLLKKFKCSTSEIEYCLNDFANNFQIFNISLTTIKTGLKIHNKYKYSFYDSLVIASALESNCNILFSEDMQDNQMIDGILRISNPFKTSIKRD